MLKHQLMKSGKRVALVHLDDWQQLKAISLLKENASENFYLNSFRWDAIFNQVISPLKKNHRLHLTFKKVKMEKDEVTESLYNFSNIDIILLEGIFLFRKEFMQLYDYKIWIDCPFDAGLQRALKRNMEDLPEETLLHDYTHITIRLKNFILNAMILKQQLILSLRTIEFRLLYMKSEIISDTRQQY